METCNVENMTKWIEALESGKYKQGKGYLRNANDEFCCVGVGLDLVDPSRWDSSRWEQDADEEKTSYSYCYAYNGKTSVDSHYSSPWSLSNWLGIKGFPKDGLKGNVYNWNDEIGMTFQDIAKKLRQIYLTPDP